MEDKVAPEAFSGLYTHTYFTSCKRTSYFWCMDVGRAKGTWV